MKKPLVCLLACAALSLAAPGDSQALTDAQHKQFLKASEDYRAADAKLNSVWKQLKGKLSPAEFRALLKDQREWISSRREVEAKGLIAQSIPEVDAYTATFTSRAAELAERLEKLGAKAAAKPETKPAEPAKTVAPAKSETKPAASAPAEKPAAKPAPEAKKPVLTITRPAEKKDEAKPEPKAEASAPAKPAETATPAEPAKDEAKSADKPARLEIGLPYLEEEPEAKPAGKPAAKPASKPAAKPEVKAQPAKPAPSKEAPKPQSDAAPNYQRATGTPEHPLAKGSTPACSGLQIVSTRHFGTNVAAPFVEMVLRNDRLANVKAVRVNGYEINKTVKAHQELPKWRPNTARTIALDVFSHTVLKDIEVEYADGSICAIDKRSGEKDFTNPYIF